MGIKSNYFRHSFNAHQDSKIRKLIKLKGAIGYAVYFVIIEVYCAKLFDDDQRKTDQEIDTKLIGSYLEVRSDTVHRCLIVMSELDLIGPLSPMSGSTVIKLSIPKALKYFGKYEKVSDEIFPNKRKEKERKEKESKVNTITPDEVLNIWNNALGERFGYCHGFGGGKHRDNILESIKYLDSADKWEDLFLKASSSKFLSGQDGNSWTVNLLWLVDYDNALKVISGNFDETKNIKHLFAGIPNDKV